MLLSFDAEQFITAVRSRVDEDKDYPATRDQIIKLIIQITRCLNDKNNRKPVLQVIVGMPITSQKQLGGSYHEVLIDLTEEEVGNDDILREIESAVEADALGEPWKIFGAIGAGENAAAEMPDLSETNFS